MVRMLATFAQTDDPTPMNNARESDASSGETAKSIVAPVTQWFYKRCFLLAGLFAAMGLYFCYDGFVGYPKANRNADIYDAFIDGKEGEPVPISDDKAAAAHRAGADGVSWAAHAATLHLAAEAPERHTADDLATQKRIAAVLGGCAFLTLLWAWVHRGRAWRLVAGEVQTPWHTKFAANSVTDIDRRRWDRGVALLISHDGDRFLKLKLDDYKYQNAGTIITEIAALHPEVRIDPPIIDPESATAEESGEKTGDLS